MHTHACTRTRSLTHTPTGLHTHTPGESEHSGELPAPSIHPPVPGMGRRGSWASARALRRGPQIRGLCEGPRGAGTLTPGRAPRPAASSLRMDPGLGDARPVPLTPRAWGPQRAWALTDEGHSLGVDDAAGQQVEVVLLAIHHHGVASVVASLGTETGSASPREACPAPGSLGQLYRQALRSPAPPSCPGGSSVRRHLCWDMGAWSRGCLRCVSGVPGPGQGTRSKRQAGPTPRTVLG